MGMLLITGKTGIGKSKLLSECIALHAPERISGVEGRG